MSNTRMDSVTFEEWLVDWVGNAGEPVVCQTLDLALQYGQTQVPSGGVWTISKRVCAVTPYATFGLPSSSLPPRSNGLQGISVAVTHTKVNLSHGS